MYGGWLGLSGLWRSSSGSRLVGVGLVEDRGVEPFGERAVPSAGLWWKFITYTQVARMNRCAVADRCALSEVTTL